MITKKQMLSILKSIIVDYRYDCEKLAWSWPDTVKLNLICGNKDSEFVKLSKENAISYIVFEHNCFDNYCVVFCNSKMNRYVVARYIKSASELRKALVNAFKKVGLLTKNECVIKDIIE